MNDWNYIGMNLRRLRKVRGLTQLELAQRSGVSRPTITNIECGVGSIQGTSLGTIFKLGRAMNVPLWLMLAPELCEMHTAAA